MRLFLVRCCSRRRRREEKGNRGGGCGYCVGGQRGISGLRDSSPSRGTTVRGRKPGGNPKFGVGGPRKAQNTRKQRRIRVFQCISHRHLTSSFPCVPWASIFLSRLRDDSVRKVGHVLAAAATEILVADRASERFPCEGLITINRSKDGKPRVEWFHEILARARPVHCVGCLHPGKSE
jgi:hypothetical protein